MGFWEHAPFCAQAMEKTSWAMPGMYFGVLLASFGAPWLLSDTELQQLTELHTQIVEETKERIRRAVSVNVDPQLLVGRKVEVIARNSLLTYFAMHERVVQISVPLYVAEVVALLLKQPDIVREKEISNFMNG